MFLVRFTPYLETYLKDSHQSYTPFRLIRDKAYHHQVFTHLLLFIHMHSAHPVTTYHKKNETDLSNCGTAETWARVLAVTHWPVDLG